MEKGRKGFFHPDRRTASPNITGRRKKFPDRNQVGFLIARHAGRSFQIDFMISGYDADEMARAVSLEYERLENRGDIFTELFGGGRAELLLEDPARYGINS